MILVFWLLKVRPPPHSLPGFGCSARAIGSSVSRVSAREEARRDVSTKSCLFTMKYCRVPCCVILSSPGTDRHSWEKLAVCVHRESNPGLWDSGPACWPLHYEHRTESQHTMCWHTSLWLKTNKVEWLEWHDLYPIFPKLHNFLMMHTQYKS